MKPRLTRRSSRFRSGKMRRERNGIHSDKTRWKMLLAPEDFISRSEALLQAAHGFW